MSYGIQGDIVGQFQGCAAQEVSAIEDNLAKLGVDYVDLLLVHFPSNVAANPPTGSAANRQEQWRAMEAIFKAGKAKAIGVSHYCKHHMEDILAIAEVKRAMNEINKVRSHICHLLSFIFMAQIFILFFL